MSTAYSPLEKAVARFLSQMPAVKRVAKATYGRLVYLKFGQKERAQTAYQVVKIGAGGENFFGYYDVSPWDRVGAQMIYHRPLDSKSVGIELFDISSGKAHCLSRTTAWNWQQGARLQWLPGKNSIVFNVVAEGRLISKILNLDTGHEFLSQMPVQTIHPDGCQALSINYRRLFIQDSAYGYSEAVDNFSPDQSPDADGIWHVHLLRGECRLILSISQLMQQCPESEMRGAAHHVNHVMYSPGGKRFAFMHRWSTARMKFSRLYVAQNPDASQLRLLMDEQMVSHYCWLDDDRLLVYGRTAEEGDHYYLIDVTSGHRQIIGQGVLDCYGDGHPGYSPDGRWILIDTYPDRARMRHLLIYDTFKECLHHIASFFAPWQFDGENRVDLHPRWSPCGKRVCVDSGHENQRGVYLLDVEDVVCL
ncbi:MAG: hypothetical protein P1P74_01460 [Desulfuromonadales bacterium]|nr:hypothetical protein [Desulfuromonadales bacterium]